MTAQGPAGVAFATDLDGVIQSVLRDNVIRGDRLAQGVSFATLLEPSSKLKWVKFLETVALEKATFGWAMDVATDSGLVSLEFGAAESSGSLIIVATSPCDGDSQRLYEQLLTVSNEQSTALRDALKRLSLLRRSTPAAMAELWREQAGINNELVNLQRELSRRNAELKRSNDKKNELLGIAAHDLRNPISSVRLYCDVLLTSAKIDDQQQRSLSRIRDICDFMVCIVDNMLDLSALEAGRLVLDLRAVDLPQLVDANVSLNRDLAAVKGINVEFSPPNERFPKVDVDPYRFEQVLNNLLSNAVKHSNPGTTITVEVRREEDVAVVAVRDQGQGIAHAELGKIFKPFERTSNRPTGGEKSTGLGLAIVDRIVRAHRGTITVESEVGKGTTFEVRLPLASKPDVFVTKLLDCSHRGREPGKAVRGVACYDVRMSSANPGIRWQDSNPDFLRRYRCGGET